jgi:hypothetical protein
LRLFLGSTARQLIRERDLLLRRLEEAGTENRRLTERVTELAWRPYLYMEGGAVYAKGPLTSRVVLRRSAVGQQAASVQGGSYPGGITSVLNVQWIDPPPDVRRAVSDFEDRVYFKELREVKAPFC